MWKYLVALMVVLLSLGGLVAAQMPGCPDCAANIITQTDTQTVDTVALALVDQLENPLDIIDSVAVGNEGLSAGVIVTKAPVNPTADQFFVPTPFARIDQVMNQQVSNLGSHNVSFGDGAKGITWNKAIQAAWLADQGVKEFTGETAEGAEYAKEGSRISQSTTQLTNNTYDYDSREHAKVLNVDNKLAMIVNNVNEIINLTANANSKSTDSQSSNGTITNAVGITIAGFDPESL